MKRKDDSMGFLGFDARKIAFRKVGTSPPTGGPASYYHHSGKTKQRETVRAVIVTIQYHLHESLPNWKVDI